MRKCWVIVAVDFDFPDTNQLPVRVFVDEARARADFAALQAAENKMNATLSRIRRSASSSDHDDAMKQAAFDYRQLGYNIEKTDELSWSLYEAELVE